MTDTQKPVIAEDLREEWEWFKAHTPISGKKHIALLERTSAAEAERDAARKREQEYLQRLKDTEQSRADTSDVVSLARQRVAELEQQIARLVAPVSARAAVPAKKEEADGKKD